MNEHQKVSCFKCGKRHNFPSSSPPMLIYSPVWFVCCTKMADLVLWLVRLPVNQTPGEGSIVNKYPHDLALFLLPVVQTIPFLFWYEKWIKWISAWPNCPNESNWTVPDLFANQFDCFKRVIHSLIRHPCSNSDSVELIENTHDLIYCQRKWFSGWYVIIFTNINIYQ